MISVCVASFNGEKYIEAQLASILQFAGVEEILVSDDGSTDRTVDKIREIADRRVRIIAGPRRGLVRNFEHMLAQARGTRIFLSDQDDVWLPGKVEATVRALQGADLVVSDCKVVDRDLNVLQPSYFALRRPHHGVLRNLLRNSYLGCCMAFNSEVLRRALPFPADLPMHDWWLGLVAEMFGTTHFLDEPMVLYRRHGGNASETAGPSTASRTTQAWWRARMVSGLLARRIRV